MNLHFSIQTAVKKKQKSPFYVSICVTLPNQFAGCHRYPVKSAILQINLMSYFLQYFLVFYSQLVSSMPLGGRIEQYITLKYFQNANANSSLAS